MMMIMEMFLKDVKLSRECGHPNPSLTTGVLVVSDKLDVGSRALRHCVIVL